MSRTPVDFVMIQPLMLDLDNWIALRRHLHELLGEGAERPIPIDRATVHIDGVESPQFDRRLDDISTIAEAFPILLQQTRDMPCIVAPLNGVGLDSFDAASGNPCGLTLEAMESRILIARSGEITLLHLVSGQFDAAACNVHEGGLQTAVRTLLLEGLAECKQALVSRIEEIIGRLTGAPPESRLAECLQPDGGHMLTLAHGCDDAVREALRTVHEIQEGQSTDERALLTSRATQEPGYAHFGWSYTTIAGSDSSAIYRVLFPLIGVNQAWYRYRQLRSDIIDMSRVIHRLATDRDLIGQTEYYSQVVLDVRVWEAERESFERGLRPMYRTIYGRLWEYWDTTQSRQTVHEGIDYLRDFLDRKYSVKMAQRESTQARTLFVIAIFQLLSVFGLISGYLYFWEKTPLPDEALYNSPVAIWITILSPVVVLIGIVWLLVRFFRNHR